MTSRISFFKLQKEDMRHRLGIVLLTMFYALMEIGGLAIQIQNAMTDGNLERKDIYSVIASYTAPNMVVTICVLCIAITMAVNGFAYLHSSTKIDLYHALPVKRKRIFWSIFCNAVLIFILLRMVASIIEMVIVAALGYMDGAMFAGILSSMICYLAIFSGIYLTAVLAMIMTGNTAVGVLGMAVFFTYIPLVICYIPEILGSTFFETYVTPTDMLRLFRYGSPASLAFALTQSLTNTGWTWSGHRMYFLALVLFIIVLAVLCQKLFEIRPSEAAGRSMAFPKANAVIRILLVIPAAIYSGYLLYGITLYTSAWWMLPGIVLGCVLFHGIIESIYQADIRGLWSHRRQMLITLVISIFIVASFSFDIYGYDAYVPDEDKLESIMIKDNNYNNRSYMFWGEEQDGISGEEKNALLKVLQESVTDGMNTISVDSDGEGESYETFTVIYTLKNGMEKQRAYTFSSDTRDNILTLLFPSEMYRKSVYSLYTCDWSKITSISWDNALDFVTMNLTEQERWELLDIYLEEFDGLTYADAKNTLPLGELTVNHSGLSNVEEYYYIYPSFQKTLAFLKEKGCDVDKTLANVSISQIEVYDTVDSETWTITDTEVIDSVKEKLSAFGGNSAYYDDVNWRYDIYVYYKDGYVVYGEQQTMAYTDADTLQTLMNGASE
ncbi:MAG: DUF6449 domain-containing protein [Clostridiales bacterium]|nr:DUF6449 domain-containing protein [Clostridiales bacterium]